MLTASLAVLVLAACGVVPQPFSHDGAVTNPMAQPGPRAGIAVLPVAGTDQGPALAQAVAEALRRLDFAAHSASAAGNGYVIRGAVRHAPVPGGNGRELKIVWAVSDPKGRPAGAYLQENEVEGTAWRRGERTLLVRLADGAARAIVPFIAEGDAAAAVARPSIAVLDVDGAPGDGRISLRRAIAFELGKAGFAVTEAGLGAGNALVLAGSVRTRPAGPARERVEITWTLFAPSGKVLGTVTQANPVAKGSLVHQWGVTAVLVARAAAPGVARLIDRATARQTGGG